MCMHTFGKKTHTGGALHAAARALQPLAKQQLLSDAEACT